MSSDPRILQPEGKTVYMAPRSKSSKYHRQGCRDLEKMEGKPVARDISIAKWKGYDPCSHCHDIETDEYTCSLTGMDVDRMRRSLVSSEATCPDMADRYNVGKTTISDHAKGSRDFDYDEKPSLPPVEWKGTWVFK